MSIFTQSPRQGRPLSGLGAFAQLLPAIRARGWEALYDAEWACDYDAIHRGVYEWLGTLAEYRWHPLDRINDAATIAHDIWERRCPQATTYVENYYGDRGGYWWGGGGHDGHHHHHHHHKHPHPPAAPMMHPGGPGPRAAPMGPRMHPGGPGPRAMPGHGGGGRSNMGPGHGGGGMRRGGHRGFGDLAEEQAARAAARAAHDYGADAGGVPITVTAAEIARLRSGAGTSSVLRNATPGTVDRMQRDVSSQVTWTAGTLSEDDIVSGGGGGGTLTLEGALPGAIAGVLGLAIGLTVISMVVGK